MENFLLSHGGVVSVLTIVVLLLVKEFIASGNGKYVTTKFCEERNKHIIESLARIEAATKENKDKIDLNREVVVKEIKKLNGTV